MVEYHQKSVSEDAFLRDQSPSEVKTVIVGSLVVSLLTISGTFLLMDWLGTDRAFNVSLLAASLVGLIIFVIKRMRSGMMVFAIGLIVFWGFITIDAPQVLYGLVFVPSFVLVSLLTSQIFRIRKIWLAALLCIPLVILPHLV
jgi:hypothetical protein